MPNSSIVSKMIRAAKLDVDLYEEVEADRTATRQAFVVVLISSIAAGLGLGLPLTLGLLITGLGHTFTCYKS